MALSRQKARKILRDKEVRGQPLTGAQKRFFGAVAGGQARKNSMKRRGRRG